MVREGVCGPEDTHATHPELEKAAADRVASLIASFRTHACGERSRTNPIAQATEADAAFIRQRHSALANPVQMRGYAGVRNLQLLLSHALGAEVVLALDDDEVVMPEYLDVATEWIGHRHGGRRTWG